MAAAQSGGSSGSWHDFVATSLNEQEDDDAFLPYSDLLDAGPPVRPLDFPTPTLFASEVTTVQAVDHRNGKSRSIESVLVRLGENSNNLSNAFSGGDDGGRPNNNRHNSEPDRAYLLRKKISKTTYGSIRVAVVLRRRPDYEADVNEVPWISTEELVAIKISSWHKIRQLRGNHIEDPLREGAALQLVGNYHPHVVGCYEILQDDKHLYTVMPYYSSGSNLHSRLFSDPIEASSGTSQKTKDRKHRYEPNEKEARDIFRQLLKGLLYLQRKGIFHRDIALENLLISKSNKVRIIDLGMSLRVPYSDPCNEGCITDVSEGESRRLMKQQEKGGRLMYMAPELLAENETFDGYSADLWASGIVLFVLCVGLAPFKFAEHSEKRYAKISSGGLRSLMKSLKISLSPEVCDLLQKMLREDPGDRLSLAEVMNHPWVLGEEMYIDDTGALQAEQQLEAVLETATSSHDSGSISSTEPTQEFQEVKLDDGSFAKQQASFLSPPDISDVHSESRESSCETREPQHSPQPNYRFSKIGATPMKLMSNAQQLGPKLMSKFGTRHGAHSQRQKTSENSSAGIDAEATSLQHKNSKSPIRNMFQARHHGGKNRNHN